MSKRSSSSSSGADGSLSAYEQQRAENIKRNAEFLSSIGLSEVKGDIAKSAAASAAARKATSRGGLEKKKAPAAQPTRRSSRVTVDKLKEELKTAEGDDKAAKEKLLEEMMSKRTEGSYEATIENEHVPRERLAGPVSLLAPYNAPDADEGADSAAASAVFARPLLDALTSLGGDGAGAAAKKAKKDASPAAAAAGGKKGSEAGYAKLGVHKEEDVAKLTGNRVYSVWAHPSPHKLLVAAGDNQGDLGLWDVDNVHGGGNSGVYKYHPHIEPITKLHTYASDPCKLYSASYDGTIRFLDLAQEAFSLGFTAPESLYDVSFRDVSFSPYDSNTMIVGRGDGQVGLVDLRSRKCAAGQYEWCHGVQDAKINSVQHHPTDPTLLVTAGAGASGAVCLHDLRKAGGAWKAVRSLDQHTKSINAAYASPDGRFLVSVSQDNTLRTWVDFTSAKGEPACAVTRHDNHTGRWLATFRPAFDPKHGSAFVLGSMDRPRRIEVFVPSAPSAGGGVSVALASVLQGDYMGSVCSRNAFHPTLDVIVASNSSGRVHIVR